MMEHRVGACEYHTNGEQTEGRYTCDQSVMSTLSRRHRSSKAKRTWLQKSANNSNEHQLLMPAHQFSKLLAAPSVFIFLHN